MQQLSEEGRRNGPQSCLPGVPFGRIASTSRYGGSGWGPQGPTGNRNLHRRFNRMKKKLLAVAVAGALAAPGLALAQSSVTISGIFKMSLDNVRIGSPTA